MPKVVASECVRLPVSVTHRLCRWHITKLTSNVKYQCILSKANFVIVFLQLATLLPYVFFSRIGGLVQLIWNQ